MDSNKAIGVDGIHVEMLNSNPSGAASLLTKMWQVVSRTRFITKAWLTGVIVPLYKCMVD